MAALCSVGLLLVAFGAGCSGSEIAEAEPSPPDRRTPESTAPGSSTPRSTTTTEAPTTTIRGPLGSGSPVTIAFGGDASFQGLDAALARDPGGLLGAIAPLLGAADIAIVNLEAALTTGGTPEPKTFTFRVPPAALDALAAAGVDVVTMANNHGIDYGPDGLAETLEQRGSSPVEIIGVGRDAADAYSPFVTEVRGQRVGIIAANDVFDSNLVGAWTATDERAGIASAEEAHQDRLADEVRELDRNVDTVVVYLHFGTERDTCPHGRQRELVDLLVGAGADVVVGSHAHRLQGLGYLGDRFVAYGLSNFVFASGSDAGRRTGVLTVTATGSRIDRYDWSPAMIENLVPVPLSGPARDRALADMDALRDCAGLSTTPTGGQR